MFGLEEAQFQNEKTPWKQQSAGETCTYVNFSHWNLVKDQLSPIRDHKTPWFRANEIKTKAILRNTEIRLKKKSLQDFEMVTWDQICPKDAEKKSPEPVNL